MEQYCEKQIFPRLDEAERFLYDALANLADRHLGDGNSAKVVYSGLYHQLNSRRRDILIPDVAIQTPVTSAKFPPLADVWRVTDPPIDLTVDAIDDNSVRFKDFSIYRDPQSAPIGLRPTLVAVPSGNRPSRLIATEPSGRFFCSPSRYVTLNPPTFTEWVEIRIATFVARREMSIVLPLLREPWALLQTPRAARGTKERIVSQVLRTN